MTELELGDAPAIFSEDRRYRYFLQRRVGFSDSRAMFLMLNPSTADEETDDPTIRRCVGFARTWGYGWLMVCNLSPLRATHPADLKAAGPEPEEIWKTNINVILRTAGLADLVVAAYGAGGLWEDRGRRVLEEVQQAGHRVHCLGVTKEGHPRHPVRLAAKTKLERFCGGKEAT